MDRIAAIAGLEYVRERCQILDKQNPPNDFFKTICESLNMAIAALQEKEHRCSNCNAYCSEWESEQE